MNAQPVTVNYWLDPICPWCWMTSRWILRVAPERNLSIRWRSISLKFKNSDNPNHPYAGLYSMSHRLLRVMEAARVAEGNKIVGALYGEFGRRIHVDQDLDFDLKSALNAVGLSQGLVGAADDESWDPVIEEQSAAGLALAGSDVGTPILGFEGPGGEPVGIFGPVLSRVLDLQASLQLWDGIVGVATTPGFWELKRGRTEPAEIGYRPVRADGS